MFYSLCGNYIVILYILFYSVLVGGISQCSPLNQVDSVQLNMLCVFIHIRIIMQLQLCTYTFIRL